MELQKDDTQSLRDRIAYLEEEILQLKDDLLPPDNPFIGKLGLSGQLAAVLYCLYRSGMVTNQKLDLVTAEYSNRYVNRKCDNSYVLKRTHVAICKVRKILNNYKVKINSVHGIGYEINAVNKAKLKKLLETEQ